MLTIRVIQHNGETIEHAISTVPVVALSGAAFEKLKTPSFFKIISIKATDESVDFIYKHFGGLRVISAKEVVWTGEDAEFIVNNYSVVIENINKGVYRERGKI